MLNERFGLLVSTENHAEAGWRTPAGLQALVHRLPSRGEAMALRVVTAASVYGAARRKGPLPYGTRVYVDELTFRVVAHATSAE